MHIFVGGESNSVDGLNQTLAVSHNICGLCVPRSRLTAALSVRVYFGGRN